MGIEECLSFVTLDGHALVCMPAFDPQLSAVLSRLLLGDTPDTVIALNLPKTLVTLPDSAYIDATNGEPALLALTELYAFHSLHELHRTAVVVGLPVPDPALLKAVGAAPRGVKIVYVAHAPADVRGVDAASVPTVFFTDTGADATAVHAAWFARHYESEHALRQVQYAVLDNEFVIHEGTLDAARLQAHRSHACQFL